MLSYEEISKIIDDCFSLQKKHINNLNNLSLQLKNHFQYEIGKKIDNMEKEQKKYKEIFLKTNKKDIIKETFKRR